MAIGQFLRGEWNKVAYFFRVFRYVGNDDPDSEIDIKSPQKYDGEDDLGKYVTQKISWEPTREELCKFDETVSFVLRLGLNFT